MKTAFTIQQISTETGFSAHTLRYYERIGLIDQVARDPGGRRRYTQANLEWLRFLMRLRDTGMPIKDMLHYAELRRQGDNTQKERGAMMVAHLEHLEQHIAHLQKLAGFVADKVRWYQEAARIPSISGSQEKQHATNGESTLHARPSKTRGN